MGVGKNYISSVSTLFLQKKKTVEGAKCQLKELVHKAFLLVREFGEGFKNNNHQIH